MIKRLALTVGALSLSLGLAHAEPEKLTAEDFAKHPAVTGVSMSLEGDVLVGIITDPTDVDKTAAAYWDISGDIDTSKPLLPSNVTPSSRSRFYGAAALKSKKSLWFTTQRYTGALRGCGEGKTTGSTKKYIQKVYLGNEKITDIDDLPDGRAEVGANKMQLRCFEITGDTGVASSLPLDPKNIILQRATTKSGTSYFKHDLSTGREKFLFKASNTENFTLDRKGVVVGKSKLEFEDGEYRSYIRLLNEVTGEFELEDALTTEIKNRYTMDVYAKENGTRNYFVGTDKFDDKVSVYLYNGDTNTFSTEPLFQHPEFDIVGR